MTTATTFGQPASLRLPYAEMGPINMVAGLKGDYGLAKNLTLLYGNKGGGVVLKVESRNKALSRI